MIAREACERGVCVRDAKRERGSLHVATVLNSYCMIHLLHTDVLRFSHHRGNTIITHSTYNHRSFHAQYSFRTPVATLS